MNRFADLRFDEPDTLGLLPTDRKRRLEPKRIMCGHGFFWGDCPCCGGGGVWCEEADDEVCENDIQIDVSDIENPSDTFDCGFGTMKACSLLEGTYVANHSVSTSGRCIYRDIFSISGCVQIFMDVALFTCSGVRYCNFTSRPNLELATLVQEKSGFTQGCSEINFDLPDAQTKTAFCAAASITPVCGTSTVHVQWVAA